LLFRCGTSQVRVVQRDILVWPRGLIPASVPARRRRRVNQLLLGTVTVGGPAVVSLVVSLAAVPAALSACWRTSPARCLAVSTTWDAASFAWPDTSRAASLAVSRTPDTGSRSSAAFGAKRS